MATPSQEVPPHAIDRTPEYEDFMEKLKDFHEKRGTLLDPEPKVGVMHLDLFKVFNHIVASGGYDKVSEEKLAWRRMAAELGLYSNNEASTAFALKEKFYKNLAAYEIKSVHNKEPPPKEILEDVTAKGANLLTRTLENFRGKRDSNMGGNDSAASGDDGTPVRERPPTDSASSARASRGLREAPQQRVLFQPDTGSTRSTRHSAAQQAAALSSPATNAGTPTGHHGGMPLPPGSHNSRGPSIANHPMVAENMSNIVTAYQPRHLKPLQLRPVATPSNAPVEFLKLRLPHRFAAEQQSRQPMLPGTGFEGPNIYTRCLNALRSGIPQEQAFALNHLVKISYERGDKYKFESFPGLAEGLVDKALEIGSLFYHVNWKVFWDVTESTGEIGALDGNTGTADILERIQDLVEKDVPDALQTEAYLDQMLLVAEAMLTVRNMVTLPENAYNMSDFYPLKDLVCIVLHLPVKDSLIEVKHLALDIAEQLTPFMILDANDPLYKTLLSQLTSEDRGVILTALRGLGRISVNLEATNRLPDVPAEVLQKIVGWLLLNDDELTDACLDFLYQYTAVVPNLDHLIRSTPPETLVDQLVRLLAHGARKVHHEVTMSPEQRTPERESAIAPMPKDLLEKLLSLEEPERVHSWVKSFFEEDKNSFVTQLSAWQAYQTAFAASLKLVGQPMITPADFIRNSTSVYPGSNAQVLRDPNDPQQKFIIHGIKARPRPLSLDGKEYGRCLWATNPAKRNEKCGHFFLTMEQMWSHILTTHLQADKKEDGQFDNVERPFVCTWGECTKFATPTTMHLQDFARHITTHISATMTDSGAKPIQDTVVPAKTMSLTFEETVTVIDERNPRLPPQAAGIPLSAVLVLRNIARNVVKTVAEEELVKKQKQTEEKGGWNERLFRAYQPRLFEILAENRAMVRCIAIMICNDDENIANTFDLIESLYCLTA